MSSRVDFDFSEAVVLVTGGGTGIGVAIASAFLHAGAKVIVAGRRPAPLEAFAAQQPDRALAASADMSVPAEIERVVGDAVARFERLDVVVINAAGWAGGDLPDLSDDDWSAMRAINIDGFFYLAKAALPLLERTQGTLLAVSSVSGLGGDWGMAGYNATKAAVSNFVRGLALDWGSRGVRVNAVAPAMTATHPTEPVTGNPALRGQYESRTALGRIARPSDIAPAVLFLASDAAAYITGVILPVDGGTSASNGQPHLQ